ncbi:hypothetical protein BGZ96_003799 [Linnemannia gamsii]|uniref:HCP-like protein n=1 Tax=Linnemannia gamsii TaxID=64522 RepID=A0ABQ7JIS8_9FUNG|nr:hypothetical protein BGZ96_003799 [Linnemannia gamsii]
MDVKEAFRRIIVRVDLTALEEKGEGTPEEFTQALECYLKAVCRGHVHAHLSVGEHFAKGENVVEDESRAFEWYLKAAYQGNAVAQRKISRLIFNQPNRNHYHHCHLEISAPSTKRSIYCNLLNAVSTMSMLRRQIKPRVLVMSDVPRS